MNTGDLQNMIRILWNIDKGDLDAVLDTPMPDEKWERFRDKPALFFITCDDTMARAIWAVVETRHRWPDGDPLRALKIMVPLVREFRDNIVETHSRIQMSPTGTPEPMPDTLDPEAALIVAELDRVLTLAESAGA